MDKLFLAVDGGGTKTEFVVFNAEGKALFRTVLGSSNPNDLGLEESVKILKNGTNICINNYKEIGYAFYGVAGAGTNDNAFIMKERMKPLFPDIKLEVSSDISSVFELEDDADTAMIIGTGFVIYSLFENEKKQTGGWGYLLDNYGSGYDIGREALRTVLKEKETQEKTLISILFDERYGYEKQSLISMVYDKKKPFIASFAKLVFNASEKGDKVALEILDNNAKYVAELLNIANNKYGTGKKIIAVGGIIENYPIYSQLIKKYYESNIVVTKKPIILGAAKLCYKQYSKEMKKEFEINFIEALKELI